MREILFRGKRVDNGEWVYGHYVHQYGADMIYLPDGTDREYGFDYYHIDKETICEFTGLCDKNGNRIWENDIVKTKFGRLCKIVWRQTQCFVGWDFEVCDFDFDVNDFSKPPSSFDLYLPENLEVIENSIDNPELLTQERSER